MIDPSCCIKKNERKIVYFLRMLQFKSIQEHTHYGVASRKNSCHFTKKTLSDTEPGLIQKPRWIRKLGQIWKL
jgi:hypothetical protein